MEAYVTQTSVFEVRKIEAWWEDGIFDVMSQPRGSRPVSIHQLWRRDELNAPEFCYLMQRLAGMWPSQSSVERANGLLWRTGGNKCRNNLSLTSRQEIALVAAKYLAQPHCRFSKLSSKLFWRQTVADLADNNIEQLEEEASEEELEEGLGLTTAPDPVGDEGKDWGSASSSSSSSSSSSCESGED